MKTIHKFILTVAIIIFFVNIAEAQGWKQKGHSKYSVGIGAGQGIFIPVYNYPGQGRKSIGVSFNVSGEYKVHRIIGIGWQAGIDIFPKGHYYEEPEDYYYTTKSIGIPVGFKLNFYFLESARGGVKDKIDLYAGINAGGGPTFHGDPYAGIYYFFYVGPQAGLRYWFNKNMAIFGELGWGATICNFGITF